MYLILIALKGRATDPVSLANFQPYTYAPVVLASCIITQHISTIFIFIAVFARLRSGSLDPRLLVCVTICCHVVGYTIWEVIEYRKGVNRGESSEFTPDFPLCLKLTVEKGAKAIKSSLLVFLALIALSPVLRTLTAATSSDSIWALSACLFILNALLADYGSSRQLKRNQER